MWEWRIDVNLFFSWIRSRLFFVECSSSGLCSFRLWTRNDHRENYTTGVYYNTLSINQLWWSYMFLYRWFSNTAVGVIRSLRTYLFIVQKIIKVSQSGNNWLLCSSTLVATGCCFYLFSYLSFAFPDPQIMWIVCYLQWVWILLFYWFYRQKSSEHFRNIELRIKYSLAIKQKENWVICSWKDETVNSLVNVQLFQCILLFQD